MVGDQEGREALEFIKSMGCASPGASLTEAVASLVDQAMTNEAGRKRLAEALGADPNERWSALLIRVKDLLLRQGHPGEKGRGHGHTDNVGTYQG